MATKTFKTRIKLKYDLQNAWENPEIGFRPLPGELLLGKNADTATKVYANVGIEDGGFLPLSVDGNYVDITAYTSGDNTISTAKGAISDHGNRISALETAVGTGGSVDTKITNAINALDVTDITGMAASKTLLTLTQTDGKIAATFQDIEIPSSKVSDFATSVKNLVVTGETNGTIKVNNSEVSVAGLGSAAYTEASAYQAKFTDGSAAVANLNSTTLTLTSVVQSGGAITNGAIAATLEFVSAPTSDNKIVTESDISGIVGAMVYKGTLGTDGATIQQLPAPTESNKGFVYVVETAGEYDEKTTQIGDMFVSNGDSWNLIQGNVPVTNGNPVIEVGATEAATIATVEGVTITAKVTANASKVTYGATNVENALDNLSGNVSELFETIGENSGDIAANTSAIDILNGDDTVDGSVAKSIKDAIGHLDSSATIASVSNDIVTLKAGVTESDGVISNSGDTDITLAKVAKTGAAADVTIADTGTLINATNVEGALAEIVGNVNANKADITANANAINTLNSDVNTTGSVAHSINAAINTTIAGLDSTVTAGTNTADSVPAADFKVLQKVAITDGKLVPSDSAHVGLKKLAATANVNDLIQTDGDCIIFDCGSASLVINTED